MAESLVDQLEVFFRQREGEWIDGRVLGGIAGAYAWRSRCADLRKRGMTIENRLRRMVDGVTGRKWVISEYRFVAPVQTTDQPSLFVEACK
jgi:hypothetical protein